MKRKIAKVGRLRLSPNEEAQLIKEEHERRRKLRLQQVREQERCIALQIRKEVQRRRECELQNLADQLQEEWQQQQREKLQTLERLYQDSLKTLGEGHRNAKENEPDLEAMAQKSEEQQERAAGRHREALRTLKTHRLRLQEEQTRHIQARKKAMLVEKERAAKVASLPPPSPEPFEKIEAQKLPQVKMSDVDNFTVTHFHMLETAVVRQEDTEQPDARQAAEEEGRRLEELGQEQERERRERLAKARLRGSHALRKEHLNQDRERLLQELEQMQQADLLRRRQAVSQMPLQTFQPVYSRQEMREDRQRDLEFAFEDMYTGERRMKGDLVLQLVPEPLPALSSDVHDDDLDVTLEPVLPPAVEEQALDHQSPLPPSEQQAEPPEAAPPHALKKLLDKIRSQRSQWSNHAGGEIPSEGMTIESGSLASADVMGGPPPVAPHPDHLQPSQGHETTEESVIPGTVLPPKTQAVRLRLAAEERRKWAEGLERQKQEQMELLQQLEEERRRLQLQMQQAQLEKERLQAAVQGSPEKTVQPEVPAHEQEVPSAPAVCLEWLPLANEAQESPEPPSSAPGDTDQHSQRLRQYHQRLLDQNRQHRQSVEEARRGLAEYQHALKMRYSRALMAALGPAGTLNLQPLQATPPPVPPPAVLHRPSVPPAAMPLPPSSGPAPLPRPGTMPNSPLRLARGQNGDFDLPSQGPSGIPAPDSRPIRPTPLLSPPSAAPFEPVAEHAPETQRGPARPPSGPPPWGDPDFTALQPPPRPAAASLTPFSQPDREAETEAEPAGTEAEPAEMEAEPAGTEAEPTGTRVEPEPEAEPAETEAEPAETEAEPMEAEPAETDAELLEVRQWQAVLEQQRAQEERLLLQQSQLREQMRRHRKALDAFLTGPQAPKSRPLESGSEVSKEERLSLMSALLRAMEESSGSLSQPPSAEPLSLRSVPTDQAPARSLCPAALPDLRSRPTAQPRAPKPPLARPRLGILEILEQHELSAIQEVETPVDASLATVADESAEASCSLAEEPAGPEDPGRSEGRPPSGSSSSTGRSSRLSWRETLQREAGSSPEPDAARAPCVQRASDHGHGALTHPGLIIPHFKAREEEPSLPCSEERYSLPSEQTPADAECLSSFTISTGSFSTNEPDLSSPAVDASLPFAEAAGRGGAMSPALRHRSSVSSQGSLSPESLLANDSIQRIIDKYTKELNTSLVSAGNFAVVPSPAETSPGAWRAILDQVESSSSISLPWPRAQIASEGRSLTSTCPDLPSVQSNQETSTQNTCRSSTGFYFEETQGGFGQSGFTGAVEEVSKYGFEGDQNSSCHFLPLEPRPDFDSSTSSSSRHSEGQERIRRPEASQVTGHLLDRSSPRYLAERRDSTRSIGHPSAQSTSHWLSEGPDITMGQSFSPLLEDPSSQSLGEGRLLTGEWEELSAGQQSGSFGGAGGPLLSHTECEAPARSGQSSESAAVREASLLKPRPDAHEATPTLTEASDTSVQDVLGGSSEGLQDTGLFQEISTGHTLALDDTADGDTTLVDPTSDSFHPLPAEVTQNEPSENSATFHLSAQDPPSPGGSDLSARTGPSTESAEPEPPTLPSPELPRAERWEPSPCPLPSPPGSLCLSQDPALTEDSPLRGPPGPDGASLARPPGGARSDASARRQGPESLTTTAAVWDSVAEVGSVTGILEEPDLSLLSLTTSTMQELSMEEVVEEEEEEEEEETRAERKKPLNKEILESVSLVEDGKSSKHESRPSHAVMLLEFQGPPSGLQQALLQKRQGFIQRSAQRLEELRARKEQSRKSALEKRPRITAQGQRSREKPRPPLAAGGGRLTKVGEVRVCTPEHRKTEEAQMYQRTERLYNQLDEVKQRKEIRSRQDSYAKNREKAKDFQKKTLQKLRAKQSRH